MCSVKMVSVWALKDSLINCLVFYFGHCFFLTPAVGGRGWEGEIEMTFVHASECPSVSPSMCHMCP